jgi:hypothetical protein
VTPPPTPTQPKPWDAPAPPSVGDADATLTYAAIGKAMTSWEKAEEVMAFLFSVLVGGGDDALPAVRAYGAVKTSLARLDMVAAAAEAFFFQRPEPEADNKKIEKEVDTAINAMKNFAARRNEIAHGQVHEIETQDGFMRTPEGYPIKKMKKIGFVVGPSYHSTSKTDLAPPLTFMHWVGRTAKYSYSSVEIDVISAGFDQLMRDIQFASAGVFSHRGRPRGT